MLRLNYILSRRVFIKMSLRILALLSGSKALRLVSIGNKEAHYQVSLQALTEQSPAYGRGAYGQGAYAGYQTYLPLVNKESD